MHSQTDLDETYKNALLWTDPKNFSLPDPGSDYEQKMLDSLEDLFSNYSLKNLKDKLPELYADRIYFRDAFKYFDNKKDLLSYMIHGLRSVVCVGFSFNHVIHSKGDYFIEWTMGIQFKGKSETETSIGITRFRFNSERKVIFHQDYWDPTTLIYKKIPIAKQLIHFVQKRI